ncbi:maleylpyruvate isomerase family mycothiol-dependent enzyme [Streptomyces flavofungini]|uniref:Maleylpyruvate isomerase family mycothiol-dependent enzyme n=1 Tax=Streptomyces flavofungini TaxID=68200 RepID=A0ABS0X723_9ACTN|nr:maleylpyruvate isomerase family mycothiol-dependent enzyme [Streptomyces flavofungini]MBJ3809002.1 maleylpyruvate isomerase family mycothiol-dependent enzyme [Streptomyces flavofungini]GHC68070.1 maleylpyruvate isomerase [Streptomyces flavofungini]
MVNSPLTPDDLVRRVSQAHALLLELLDRLDDRQKDAASALPGWTRGHVLKHLADNARAFERQARGALQGEVIDMYDGGQDGRDQSIDQGAARPLAELREELKLAQGALEDAWSGLAEGDWGRAVRFRHATVVDTALARWREVEIHAVDLDFGYRAGDWPLDFALHALEFLSDRAPAGTRLLLRATDHEFTQALGTGTTVEVSGAVRDLAAWMAGRSIDGHLSTTGLHLPELGPWPPDPAD